MQSQSPTTQLNNLSLHLYSVDNNITSSGAQTLYDTYMSNGDLDTLKSNNLSFLNKLTYSTSNSNLNYFTVLPYTLNSGTNGITLVFKK